MTRDRQQLDTFTRAYIECALWSSTDDDGEPLDTNYSLHDIAPESLGVVVRECEAFQEQYWDNVASDLERAGHDFWLTRNGHGAGFWDGDWPKTDGKILTDASCEYGVCDLYIGDDGKLHVATMTRNGDPLYATS